jgi:hypothetical protein
MKSPPTSFVPTRVFTWTCIVPVLRSSYMADKRMMVSSRWSWSNRLAFRWAEKTVLILNVVYLSCFLRIWKAKRQLTSENGAFAQRKLTLSAAVWFNFTKVDSFNTFSVKDLNLASADSTKCDWDDRDNLISCPTRSQAPLSSDNCELRNCKT